MEVGEEEKESNKLIYERSQDERITIDLSKCQGCGSCVVACPNGGFKVINGKSHIVNINFCDGLGYCIQACPMNAIFYKGQPIEDMDVFCRDKPKIGNWPIKLEIISAQHPSLKNAEIILVADCAPLILRNFDDMSKGKVILTMCPKLSNPKNLREKISSIINKNNIKSIESINVDYICCEAFPRIVKDGIRFSNKKEQFIDKYKNYVVCLFGIGK
ncbi:MAG: ATP-binding protein [Promethearchaeota archaeon]